MNNPHSEKPRKVLIVEDESIISEYYSFLIEKPGREIFIADCGRSALELLDKNTIDLIISDINMPNLDGLSLLEINAERNIFRPTILVSGHATKDIAIKSLKLGAFDLLDKPIVEKNFLATIDRAFSYIDQQDKAIEIIKNTEILNPVDKDVRNEMIKFIANASLRKQ